MIGNIDGSIDGNSLYVSLSPILCVLCLNSRRYDDIIDEQKRIVDEVVIFKGIIHRNTFNNDIYWELMTIAFIKRNIMEYKEIEGDSR